MQTTTNYGLKKPEGNEFISIADLNENADKVDEVLKGLDEDKVDSNGGDIANTKVSEFAANSTQWPVPAAGESPKTLWGKVKKFTEDFKNWMSGVCLIGQIVNNCVTNNANLPLSAAQGKALMDLYTVLNTNLSARAYKGAVDYSGMDSVADSGLYSVGNPAGCLIHIRWDDNYSFQILHNHTEKKIQFRSSSGNVWSQWFVLGTTNLETVTLGDWMTLYKVSGIVTVRIGTVRSTGFSKDTKYVLTETVPAGYRPPHMITVPVRFTVSSFLSSNGDGIIQFHPNGSIEFYSSVDRESGADVWVGGCASWPAT